MSNGKNYHVKKVEPAETTQNNPDTKIRNNLIFALAGLIAAGVAFGVGDQIFESSTIQTILAFGGIGISGANIRIMREKLKLKTGKTNAENEKQRSKGR